MNVRRGLLTSLLVAAAAIAVSAPVDAYAYTQDYCNHVVNVGQTCYSNGLHSVDSNLGRYEGPPQHNVQVCEYVWNHRTGQVRGGINICDNNVVFYYYGPTSQADYNARIWLGFDECCPHTISGQLEA